MTFTLLGGKFPPLFLQCSDSIIMAIVLCQIHVQAVEYILDDQTINSEQVCGSIVNLLKCSINCMA